jgi:amino acid transporter
VVVIDGRDRGECAALTPAALSASGVIVFDNTDRAQYAHAVQGLLRKGFRRIEFVGMVPVAAVKSETSIFYKPGNCLGI